MEEVNKIKYKELMSTFNTYDIALIKSLLDTNNIRYYIEGKNFLQVRPLAVPAKIMIDETQIEAAKELLEEFKESIF